MRKGRASAEVREARIVALTASRGDDHPDAVDDSGRVHVVVGEGDVREPPDGPAELEEARECVWTEALWQRDAPEIPSYLFDSMAERVPVPSHPIQDGRDALDAVETRVRLQTAALACDGAGYLAKLTREARDDHGRPGWCVRPCDVSARRRRGRAPPGAADGGPSSP